MLPARVCGLFGSGEHGLHLSPHNETKRTSKAFAEILSVVLALLLCCPAAGAEVKMLPEACNPTECIADSTAPMSPATEISNIENRANSGIYQFKPLQLIIPAAMIGVGVVGLESHWIIRRNTEIRDELQESGHGKFTADDFMQFAPSAAVYGLELCGVKGVHNYGEKTIILGTAAILTLASVYTIKATANVERPDGSAKNSFPSGHTAFAFMGAEILHREYWHVSPWIGIAGYSVAAATGFLRMYNNRHWATDVLAGAGIGILSAEIAYWVYPYVSKLFYPGRRSHRKLSVGPFVSSQAKGLACMMIF